MNDPNSVIRDRIRQTQSRMLDEIDNVLDRMAERTAATPSPPLAVARRQLANAVRLWMFCDRSACRRAQCCRGEPSHCLRIALPLLPPDLLVNFISAHKRKRRP